VTIACPANLTRPLPRHTLLLQFGVKRMMGRSLAFLLAAVFGELSADGTAKVMDYGIAVSRTPSTRTTTISAATRA
jgi:hypothetical protein